MVPMPCKVGSSLVSRFKQAPNELQVAKDEDLYTRGPFCLSMSSMRKQKKGQAKQMVRKPPTPLAMFHLLCRTLLAGNICQLISQKGAEKGEVEPKKLPMF